MRVAKFFDAPHRSRHRAAAQRAAEALRAGSVAGPPWSKRPATLYWVKFSAFFEIYKICIILHRSKIGKFVKILSNFCSNFAKIQQQFLRIRKIRRNPKNLAKKRKKTSTKTTLLEGAAGGTLLGCSQPAGLDTIKKPDEFEAKLAKFADLFYFTCSDEKQKEETRENYENLVLKTFTSYS